MSEIRCDGCHVIRQYAVGVSAEQAAAADGWHITDITLCPTCSDLWIDPPREATR